MIQHPQELTIYHPRLKLVELQCLLEIKKVETEYFEHLASRLSFSGMIAGPTAFPTVDSGSGFDLSVAYEGIKSCSVKISTSNGYIPVF